MDTAKVLAVFAAVVRANSFTQAAQATGLTPPAVSRSIALLEAHLGVRLFHRTTRRVSLTEEGAKLFELADEGLRLLDEAMDRTLYLKQNLGGLIRLAAPRSVSGCLLVPLIAAFRDRHPAVQFEAILETQFTDLVGQKIDVGFRIGRAPQSRLIAREIGKLSLAVCASPAYVERHGLPRTVDELAAHACTGFRSPNTGRTLPWTLDLDGESVEQEVSAAIAFNDVEAEVHAVCAGIGIGQLPYYLAAPLLRAGALVPVLRACWSERDRVYLYYPHRKRIPARVRTFIDFTTEWVRTHPLEAAGPWRAEGAEGADRAAKRASTPRPRVPAKRPPPPQAAAPAQRSAPAGRTAATARTPAPKRAR